MIISLQCSIPSDTDQNNILFSQSFDDDRLDELGWYDGSRIRISEDSFMGTGCIEYEWIRGANAVQGSSAKRRLFEPVDDIYVRFYIRLNSLDLENNKPNRDGDELVISTKRVGPISRRLLTVNDPDPVFRARDPCKVNSPE